MWRIYSIHNVLFILHRVTGVALLVYLLAHIWVVSSAMLGGAGAFDAMMSTLTSRSFFVLELFLFASLLFHALNGLRLMAHEHGLLLAQREAILRATVIATLTAGLAACAAAIGL